MKTKFQAFTILEIAIVMTIIGIMTMGVIKGKQLLEQARLEKTINQIESIIICVESFKNMYGFLPGDYTGSEFGMPGNGDGALNNINKQTAFWVHLEKSDILKKPNPSMGGIFAIEYENGNYLIITNAEKTGALTFIQAAKIKTRLDNVQIKDMKINKFIETTEQPQEKKYNIYIAIQ